MAFATVMVQAEAQKTINDPNAEVRTVSGFHAIRISNAIDLYLTQSDQEAVAVSASEAKYRDQIRTVVENGVLKIYVEKDNWKVWNRGDKKLRAYVSFKTLDKLHASGAVDVTVEGVIKSDGLTINLSGASDFKGKVETGSLVVDQSGASDATVSGSASNIQVEVSGASRFRGNGLQTENCKARASGASDVTITVNKELRAHASGASKIQYSGDGVIKEVHTSGASSINKRG